MADYSESADEREKPEGRGFLSWLERRKPIIEISFFVAMVVFAGLAERNQQKLQQIADRLTQVMAEQGAPLFSGQISLVVTGPEKSNVVSVLRISNDGAPVKIKRLRILDALHVVPNKGVSPEWWDREMYLPVRVYSDKLQIMHATSGVVARAISVDRRGRLKQYNDNFVVGATEDRKAGVEECHFVELLYVGRLGEQQLKYFEIDGSGMWEIENETWAKVDASFRSASGTDYYNLKAKAFHKTVDKLMKARYRSSKVQKSVMPVKTSMAN